LTDEKDEKERKGKKPRLISRKPPDRSPAWKKLATTQNVYEDKKYFFRKGQMRGQGG